LDNLIAGHAGTSDAALKVTVLGSRDSFVDIYKNNGGRYKTHKVPPYEGYNATERRKNIGRDMPKDSPEFRQGVIYATQKQFDKVFGTVDIAAYKQSNNGFELLLGIKDDGQGWRFPGGFLDPVKDDSAESAAKREFAEECGINVN
jgi:bifunctional NMN adenylyltransferase/nudix hydrolase